MRTNRGKELNRFFCRLLVTAASAAAIMVIVTKGAATMPRETFDAVSIRPSAPSSDGDGARGGGSSGGLVPCPGSNTFAMQTLFELNPGRVVIRNVPVYYWIALAYGNEC